MYTDDMETIEHIKVESKMQTGKANMVCHNQVTEKLYINIATDYRLEVPKSR